MKYRVKIVPWSDTNAEGRWIKVTLPKGVLTNNWQWASKVFEPHLPADHFMVQYERDHEQG